MRVETSLPDSFSATHQYKTEPSNLRFEGVPIISHRPTTVVNFLFILAQTGASEHIANQRKWPKSFHFGALRLWSSGFEPRSTGCLSSDTGENAAYSSESIFITSGRSPPLGRHRGLRWSIFQCGGWALPLFQIQAPSASGHRTQVTTFRRKPRAHLQSSSTAGLPMGFPRGRFPIHEPGNEPDRDFERELEAPSRWKSVRSVALAKG
jgi:hypothetical protein